MHPFHLPCGKMRFVIFSFQFVCLPYQCSVSNIFFPFFIFATSSLSPTSYLLLTIYHCNFFIKLHYHFVFLNFKFQHHETNDFTWLASLRLYNVHIAQKWQQKKNMAWLTTYYTFKDVIIQIHIFQNSCEFYSRYTKLKVKSYH